MAIAIAITYNIKNIVNSVDTGLPYHIDFLIFHISQLIFLLQKINS
jgi:hypothetical protein